MYCIQCGAPNSDNSSTCQSCGAALVKPYQANVPPLPTGNGPTNPYQAGGLAPMSGQIAGQRPQNYLVWAILTTLCCGCLPFGIVAIVYAAQVDSKFASGDYAGAQASSDAAKMWCMISFGLGITATLVYFVLMFLGAMAGNMR